MGSTAVRVITSALLFATLGGRPAQARGPRRDRPTRVVDALTEDCRRAAVQWRRSCPGRLVHGLCATKRAGVAPHGIPHRLQARRPAALAAALATYRKVVQRWQGGRLQREIPADHPQRLALLERLRDCVAAARFTLNEPGFETFLRDVGPQDLDLNPANPARAKADLRRMSTWLREKLKAGSALIKAYLEVITKIRVEVAPGKRRGSPPWSVAAILRSGQTFQGFADAIQAMPVPAMLKGPDARAAYEAQILRFAMPLREKARARYRICLKLARDLSLPAGDPWVKFCKAALAALPPPSKP